MNKPMSDKEKVLSMLTEIHNQLEDLEMVLEESFSDHRTFIRDQEHHKLIEPVRQLGVSKMKIETGKMMENGKLEMSPSQTSRKLKLEMGF